MPTDASPPPGPAGPLFRPVATTVFRVALAVAAVAVVTTGLAVLQYYHSPYWNGVGRAPTQPVMFSHRHHAGELRLDCRFCHATVETSAFAGLPATETCLNCHGQLFTDTAMLAPVVRSAALNQPIAWARVTRLPDHVYFNHSVHVAQGVACATCHGDVGRMALTAKAQPLDMRQCLECHRDPAPRLSARAEVFAAVRASARLPEPAPRPIASPRHLENCSTCHH